MQPVGSVMSHEVESILIGVTESVEVTRPYDSNKTEQAKFSATWLTP